MATLATYIGGLCHHDLAAGERGLLLCIAPDQRQAAITLDYCAAAFEASPVLAQLIANRTSDALILTNGVSVEVRAASFRRLRGPTYIAVIADEAAFWYSDEFSANADSEILNAVRPGLATTGGPLIIASSPYARRGVLWDIHRRHYGPDGDPLILVAQGASRDFNPSLKQAVVDRAMERDPASAAAEYMAQFRTDIEFFVNREAVEACVALDIRERAPQSGLRYSGFVDPSGGSQDSFTLAVAHRDSDAAAVLDAVREVRPPFSPESVVAEFAATLRSYRVTKVSGDRYAGEWPREQFRKFGITYEVAAKPKSDLFRDLLPMLNSRKVELLDHPKLIAQLSGLERRTARSGRDCIDHAPGAHDDVANAAPVRYSPLSMRTSAVRFLVLMVTVAAGSPGAIRRPVWRSIQIHWSRCSARASASSTCLKHSSRPREENPNSRRRLPWEFRKLATLKLQSLLCQSEHDGPSLAPEAFGLRRTVASMHGITSYGKSTSTAPKLSKIPTFLRVPSLAAGLRFAIRR